MRKTFNYFGWEILMGIIIVIASLMAGIILLNLPMFICALSVMGMTRIHYKVMMKKKKEKNK